MTLNQNHPGISSPSRARSVGVATVAVLLALTAGMAAMASAQKIGDGTGGVRLRKVGQFDSPVHVTSAPGYRNLIFVVEQPGEVRVIRNGKKLKRPFLKIRDRVLDGGERGLLSVAFPPNYKNSKRFYVYYTGAGGNIRVDEFKRRSATVARPNSRRSVITIPHPGQANHNGGQLQFNGGQLFFATGDGGGGGDVPGNAQNLDSLLGKLIRINPRPRNGRHYSIPSDNPFAGARNGRGEIYSYGLRNPWRFSFDRTTGPGTHLVIGDVGQELHEEIDYTTLDSANGSNFGWNHWEGFAPYTGAQIPDTTKPIFTYDHSDSGGCAVVGGYVVRDKRLRSLYGRYVFSDSCDTRLRSLVPQTNQVASAPFNGLSLPASPTSFGEDRLGHLYVSTLDGPVYRIVRK